jgi:DNA-binding response OmpR family regulator
VILTSSAAEQDVLQSYERNANAYVRKPIDIDEFLAAIRSLGDFWLAVVQLPRQ